MPVSLCCMQGPTGGSVNFYWLGGGGGGGTSVSTHPTNSRPLVMYISSPNTLGMEGVIGLGGGVIEGKKRKALMMGCEAGLHFNGYLQEYPGTELCFMFWSN